MGPERYDGAAAGGLLMSTWVDFKAMRRDLSFRQVLQYYKVEVKARGVQHHGFCPLPSHNGKRNSPSFSAHLEKGIFHCFGCGAKGNVLDFAVLMDGGDRENAEDVRKTAIALQERFRLKRDSKRPQPEATPPSPRASNAGTILINARLDFELKTLDYEHPYLRDRKFTDEIINEFGLGFCSKGYLAGRIAIPLHDQLGRLVGYAGRIVDDVLIDEENPKYRFPGTREHKGIVYEFRKTEFLYGGYRLKEPQDDLIVFEGFPSIWWSYQHRITNVVSLMGWSCSEAQAKLIVSHTKEDGRVWLVSDGDEAGNQCAESVLPQIAPYRFIRWLKLDKGKQPTDYEPKQLKALLNW
jgi:DNA primase